MKRTPLNCLFSVEVVDSQVQEVAALRMELTRVRHKGRARGSIHRRIVVYAADVLFPPRPVLLWFGCHFVHGCGCWCPKPALDRRSMVKVPAFATTAKSVASHLLPYLSLALTASKALARGDTHASVVAIRDLICTRIHCEGTKPAKQREGWRRPGNTLRSKGSLIWVACPRLSGDCRIP